jgi:glucan phosphoethanolaminetransferase (alkaline phosphatase superfamily)
VSRRRYLLVFFALHVSVSALVAGAFVWSFGHSVQPAMAHAALIVEWDALMLTALVAMMACGLRPGRMRIACGFLPAVTFTLQTYLYVLNIVSNLSWGRNISGQLVASFAPTIWSEREPFPIGRIGVSGFVLGTFVLMLICSRWWSERLNGGLRAWLTSETPVRGRAAVRRASIAVAFAITLCALFAATVRAGVHSDDLPWKTELVSSLFRPDVVAFEPTARRREAAERDVRLRAAYPKHVAGAHLKNVVLIIVDSLRADRMQMYGYGRETTPFLSEMVERGRMKQVENAFSTCSESFCGITSTLTGREFRDVSARDFQLQDVLADEGYQTWFLLSGNHRAWNGLPQFYHARGAALFDGSDTRRYTMDDDRLVLEGLERVPPASPEQPAFFYIHLMSTHYLGVQFPESHVFTSLDDRVAPGLEPYKILDKLNKPDRYDDKVRQADGIIRRVFDALEEKHYLDDAVVVVTGDHGEGLGERHWAHGWDLYNEDIRIPLLLYDAPEASYGNLSFATQVDIAPTIVDRLGLPIPQSWEGRSLRSPAVKAFSLHQTYFIPHRFAVLYRTDAALFKFIATPQYGREELYDLTHDPGERGDIAAERPAITERLRAKVSAYREGVD